MNSNVVPLKQKSREDESNRDHPHSLQYLAGKRSGLYGEEYFLSMLHLERKRTERCGRPFCLMLLNLEKFPSLPTRRRFAMKICQLLYTLTRETDMKGWYIHDSVIGVILTDTDKDGAEHLERDIREGLDDILLIEPSRRVRITIHSYPEENGAQEPHEASDLTIYPDLTGQHPHRVSLMIKRAIDVAGSLFGLTVLAPVLLLIALLIKMTSKGPVLFKQIRMGQYGEKFVFLKFRTMYPNNDPSIHKKFVTDFICDKDGCKTGDGEGQKKVFKIIHDPRVTPLGRFLRKSSLDELPQLYNVLKGEMSLVGPRPPIPYEYESYDIWHKRRVVEIKPGITGLWQVRGRSSTTFNEMVRLDIQYMKEWSLWLDIKILIQTPLAVFFSRGAY
jgi:exopolysaccharide biosynthesis polyprenyl glycosylphosphotransferase